MTPREALDTIRKELSQAFGDALAARIVEAAGSRPQEDIDAASYRAVLASLSRDERIQGMFGELGVQDRLKRWEKLA